MSLIRPRSRLLLALAALAAAAGLTGGAASADPLQERRDQLEHRLDAAKERVAAARDRERSVAAEIAATSEQIAGVETELHRLNEELAAVEGRLTQARERLVALEDQVARRTAAVRAATRDLGISQQRLNDRLVEVYMGADVDLVAILLGASGLEDALDGLELRQRVLEHDTKLVAQVSELRARVTRERAEAVALRERQQAETAVLAEQVEARRTVQARLVARRETLSALRSERHQVLASVRVDREAWEAQADALEAQSEQVARIIASTPAPAPRATAAAAPSPAPPSSAGEGESATATAPASPTTPPPAPAPAPAPTPAAPSLPTPSQGFVWPVRGPVVSPYGLRWGRLHAGIDIAAPAGTPIVASAAGRVIYAGSMSGYGLMVIIQHAGGVATAYAHNSRNSVGVGQTVAQGQVIGAVGCTGSCFGDHVHFEVRVNGSPVDPMRYL